MDTSALVYDPTANDDFINDSLAIAGGYSSANQIQAAQALPFPNAVFVGYSHQRGATNPWQNGQQSESPAIFDGYYDYEPIRLQPQPQPQMAARSIEQAQMISYTLPIPLLARGSGASTPSTLSPERMSSPSPSMFNQQQAPSSPPPAQCPQYGEIVSLTASVHKLCHDERLKALIDNEVLMVNHEPSASSNSPKRDLFIFHVPNDMSNKELHDLFSGYGNLSRVHIQVNNDGTCRGFAFVKFMRLSDAVAAVHSLNGFPVRRNKVLSVTYCEDKPPVKRQRPPSGNSSDSTSSSGNGTNDSARNRKAARGRRSPTA